MSTFNYRLFGRNLLKTTFWVIVFFAWFTGLFYAIGLLGQKYGDTGAAIGFFSYTGVSFIIWISWLLTVRDY